MRKIRSCKSNQQSTGQGAIAHEWEKAWIVAIFSTCDECVRESDNEVLGERVMSSGRLSPEKKQSKESFICLKYV